MADQVNILPLYQNKTTIYSDEWSKYSNKTTKYFNEWSKDSDEWSKYFDKTAFYFVFINQIVSQTKESVSKT